MQNRLILILNPKINQQMISTKNLLICLFYGLLSTCQTLNSRYLFRTIGFDYYSFAFFVQRIVNIIIFMTVFKTPFRKDAIKMIIPYSIIMCTTNILSSYCVTVLPLAAFMAFKKFTVFFILLIAIAFSFPHKFNKLQYSCIFVIVIGGILVGQKDILRGEFIGYIAAVCYNVCEAGSLEYQSYMRRQRNFEPQELFLLNSVISLPYYLTVMTYEAEYDDIYNYFERGVTPMFMVSFSLLLILACLSEFTASYIAMKISPFEKATVSNIKDIALTFISVYYFKDFLLSLISQVGIFLCLSASVALSYTLLQQDEEGAGKHAKIIAEPYEEVELSIEERIEKQLTEKY